MKKETTLPPVIATFIRAVNDHDAETFLSTFANDAVVSDVGQELRGAAAIKEWSKSEIFDVNVTLDVVDVAERDGETVVTVKVDGTFDKTGLPDPLLLNHRFTLDGGKITTFSSRLAGEE
jgi:uncharacterized protein (TIGR02246 family)